MTRSQKPILCALFLALLPRLDAAESAPAESLEAALVETYTAWRNSMLEGDYKSWSKHTSTYRRAVTRNNIVSQKLRFPAALFEVPMKPAAIDGLTPIQARAVGGTSQLVYFGRIDVGVEPPEGAAIPESLLILKFIKEGTAWKFNTLSLLNLTGSDEIKAKIANKDYEFLEHGNFVPPGFVPPAPPACPVPAYVSQVQITSFGYTTEVIINGISRHKISDTATSALVIGGLKSTQNKVTVRCTPIAASGGEGGGDDDLERKVQVSVFAMPNRSGSRPHKSWEFKPTRVPPSYNALFYAMPR